MSDSFILSIDQSTSGTKAILFDKNGCLVHRNDLPHRQIISSNGWVEHDPMEIYQNTLRVVRSVIDESGIHKDHILGVGISNQRETALVWDRETGEPVFHAVVWQCSRGEAICRQLAASGYGEKIQTATGLHLSPYFSAAKIAWILQNAPALQPNAHRNLCAGTMDSWLIYKLTEKKSFKTDYSNASRTQLLNIHSLQWDADICSAFGISLEMLPEVSNSNDCFGMTDFEGYLNTPIPIHGVLGDSHGALFGQGCLQPGMIKATYGTGSSVMMHIGKKPIFSQKGIVTSLAWGMDGEVSYVLEGNINYTGAAIKWLIEDLQLISSAKESSAIALEANPSDETYLVPAFTGLGAPYWDSSAKAALCNMTRTTTRAEIVKAALDSIAYQIKDLVELLHMESGLPISALRVDGGPTQNQYLMQFQSDILDIPVQIPDYEELSALGAAYVTGIALGIYDKELLLSLNRTAFTPNMSEGIRVRKYSGWKSSVDMVLHSKRLTST